jgi:outer membrane receptor protein involved in Fe transport
MHRPQRQLARLLLLVAAAMPAVALCDEAAAPPPSQPAAEQPQQLEEVIVTAQKQQQTLEQVPASVSSMSGDFIDQTGARTYDELQNYTANTNLQVSPSSTQLLIRGFGTLNDVPGLDPSVGVVVDGVVYTYPEYLSAFFGDIARYEVLRGPQGTLFGKNVTAGLLNITTGAPEPLPFAQLDIDARSYGDWILTPVLNTPLGDNAALRLSGYFDQGDNGALYNSTLHRPEQNPRQQAGRMRLRYDSHEGWTMDFQAFLSHITNNFNKQQLFIASPAMQGLARYYDPAFRPSLSSQVSENVPALEASIIRGAAVTFDGDVGHPGGMQSLHITSITGAAENIISARDLDADFSPVPFISDSLAQPQPERQFTQELRVSGEAPDAFGLGHKANFVAGLYYDNYTIRTSDNFQIQDLGAAAAYLLAANPQQVCSLAPGVCAAYPGAQLGTLAGQLGSSIDQVLQSLDRLLGQPLIQPQSIVSGLSQRTKDYAAFGQGEWYFARHWSLLAGLRYAKEDRNGEPHSYSSSPIIQAIAGQQNFDVKLHRVETDFSPKAGIKWQPAPHTEAYFTWAEGYKSGGFNSIPLNEDSIEYDPEQASSLEAGFKIKDRLLGGPIRGSISIYRTRFSNLQVSTFQGTNVVVVNAANARSQGFESDLMWLLPVRGLSLYGSFGYADARYTWYPDGPVPGDSPTPTQDLTGKRLPFAPDWTAALTPAYTFADLGHGISATTAVDVLYQGSRYLNSEDDPRTYQPSTLLVNARVVFADQVGGRWALTLGVQNLTSELYYDQVIDQPLAPGNFAAIRSDRGRAFTGKLRLRFE